MYERARLAQNEFKNQRWGPVRISRCWPLLLVARGLALHVGLDRHASDGYKLAADWAQNYDSRHGNGLHGPSRAKQIELMRFMLKVEEQEEER